MAIRAPSDDKSSSTGKSATVIGVVPQQFQGMYSIFETQVYLPMSAMLQQESASLFWDNRDRRRILAFGRLKPEISLREAQSFLDVITARLARKYPATDGMVLPYAPSPKNQLVRFPTPIISSSRYPGCSWFSPPSFCCSLA